MVTHQQYNSRQQYRVSPHSTFTTPDAQFDCIHIDIVGPLPPSKSYSYILTCIERFTHWTEALPLVDYTAATITRTFISGWISCFETPSTITTDCGQQFVSVLWKHLMEQLVSARIRSTAYHSISNGMVEHFHRQLKTAFKAYPNSTQWTEALPIILLSIRAAVKQDLRDSAAKKWFMMLLFVYQDHFSTHKQTTTWNQWIMYKT